MKALNSLWSEFKAFAFKGNMIDLAVAVVIGAAFSGVINSLVKDIIMPSISYVTTAAKEAKKTAEAAVDKASAAVGIATTKPADTQPTTEPTTQPAATQPAVAAAPPPPPPAPAPAPAPAKDEPEKPVDLSWKIGRIEIGHFIAELLNFVIIAFAVFIIIVKLLGSVMKKASGGTPAPSEPTTKECPECLSVIPLKAKRCSHCTAVLSPTP